MAEAGLRPRSRHRHRTGIATLGAFGFEGRFDYTAIGGVVNLASRLCSEAQPGQILIDRRARAALDDEWGAASPSAR